MSCKLGECYVEVRVNSSALTPLWAIHEIVTEMADLVPQWHVTEASRLLGRLDEACDQVRRTVRFDTP